MKPRMLLTWPVAWPGWAPKDQIQLEAGSAPATVGGLPSPVASTIWMQVPRWASEKKWLLLFAKAICWLLAGKWLFPIWNGNVGIARREEIKAKWFSSWFLSRWPGMLALTVKTAWRERVRGFYCTDLRGKCSFHVSHRARVNEEPASCSELWKCFLEEGSQRPRRPPAWALQSHGSGSCSHSRLSLQCLGPRFRWG